MTGAIKRLTSTNSFPPIRACLFDMDGLLLGSLTSLYESFSQVKLDFSKL